MSACCAPCSVGSPPPVFDLYSVVVADREDPAEPGHPAGIGGGNEVPPVLPDSSTVTAISTLPAVIEMFIILSAYG